MRLASTMPDFFLMRYAESVAADPSLLSVALGYLDHCATLQDSVKAIQISFIQRAKPTTTRLTNNVRTINNCYFFPLSCVFMYTFTTLVDSTGQEASTSRCH